MAPGAVNLPVAETHEASNGVTHSLKGQTAAPTSVKAPQRAPLDASRLIVERNPCPRAVPLPGSPEAGKKIPTDHMITCTWSAETGWDAPKLGPYGPISLEPTASVLHYATECFEGMKVYRGLDDKLRLFRPNLNAERFQRSSVRCTLPDFDPLEVVKLILALCALDAARFLPADPKHEMAAVRENFIANGVLYIRPTMIGTDADLGIKPPQTAMLFIVMTAFPLADAVYLSRAEPGLRLLASPANAVRAWPGGFGGAKLGANYGPSLLLQTEAARQGYDQVLWLYSQPGTADSHHMDRVTEVGASNFFVVWRTRQGDLELCTAPTGDGTILEGVTRRSVLELGAERLEARLRQDGVLEGSATVAVKERWFTMADILQVANEGRLVEAFAAGTAFYITPVALIHYQGAEISMGTAQHGPGPVATLMRQWLYDIQFGLEPHSWGVVVPGEQ